jgi:N-dimethylarginine dimethylaminohydrolase
MPLPQPHILMCPPTYYGIEYEINPWMSRARQADRALAQDQWTRLTDLLAACGAKISLLDPIKGLPGLVFTANAAMVYRDKAVLANFRHPERQAEERYFATWLGSAGFDILNLPDAMNFEGAGDALFCGETLFAGYRMRSDARGHQRIGEMLGCHVIPLELVDAYYYHLDTCFCPLSPGNAIYFPAAFDDYGRRVLQEYVPELIAVEPGEAQRFACNAVVVGQHVITNTGCPNLHAQLRSHGFETHETPLDEFVKAGGSAKCLTLRLDGEEAAAWKYAAQVA